MINMKEFTELCQKLRKDPSSKLWIEFSEQLRQTEIKHYRISYSKGKVDSEEDLITSYISLLDKDGEEVSKIPIYLREGTHVRGALYYLRGLTRK